MEWEKRPKNEAHVVTSAFVDETLKIFCVKPQVFKDCVHSDSAIEYLEVRACRRLVLLRLLSNFLSP